MKKYFTFTGTGKEYFKIWIVNILLTIVTLGIYSAWATVRTKRYFYGNTHLDDNNFEYHAKPMQILTGRVLAIVLLIAYAFLSQVSPIAGGAFILVITLLMPLVIMRSMKFNARMTSYRNVRFSFHGLTWEAYKIYLLIPLLPLIIGAMLAALLFFVLGIQDPQILLMIGGLAFVSVFALIPLVETFMTRYQFDHLQFGQGQFFTKVRAKPIYKIYLRLLGIVLLSYLIIGVITFAASLLMGGGIENSEMKETVTVILMIIIVPLYIAFILFGLFTKAYLQSHKRNYFFSQTGLDNVLILESTLKTWPLFKLLAINLLLLIVTLGLAKPFIMVRTQQHVVDNTFARINGDLGQYVTKQQAATSSFGDELGDAFDLEGGFEVGV